MPIVILRSFRPRAYKKSLMAEAHLSRRIRHSPDDLVHLVSNVEAYPEFINLISAMRVMKRTSVTDTHERFEADATVSYKFISESFSSVVDVHSDKRQINVRKAERGGAVKRLQNDWTFHPLEDGSTLVEFFIEVKLKAYPLEILLRDKFGKASIHIMNLFEKKASQVYPRVGTEEFDVQVEYAKLKLKSEMI